MSPIGRVFIVLNLILAGTFVGFAGTYLQRQDNYKKQYESEKDARAKENAQATKEKADLTEKVNHGELDKTQLQNQLNSVKNEKDALADENKVMNGRLTSMEADYKAMNSSFNGMKTEVASAFQQIKDSTDKSITADAAKDAAVREKDDAVAKLVGANAKIAEHEETIKNKDVALAGLTKDKGELSLLVDVARLKGFIDQMATPPLGGTVVSVSDKLCTLSITSNPTNAEIKRGYKFAIYDGSTYKGEARVTDVDESKKAVFCTLDLIKGNIKAGDSAATQTN